MILFIHGFASRGLGDKSRALIDYFGASEVLTPDLPHQPDTAVALLERLLREHPIDLLVGSSLGGYFATWLNRNAGLPAVLINPAIAPSLLLDDYLGEHTSDSGERFVLTRQHLDDLRAMYRPRLRDDERYLVLLQSGDEILDYRQAATYYAAKDVVVEPGGDHRFRNFSNYLPRIAAWRTQHAENR
jgi:uncharacterized protein